VTHLHSTDILSSVCPRQYPALVGRGVCLCNLDRKILEYTAEKLEIRELYGVDSDILAQLHNNELLLPLA